MLPRGDSLSLTAAEAASVSHRYGLLSFEVQNFMDKWFHRVYTAFPWTDTETEDRQRDLAQYLEIVPLIRDADFRVLEESSRDSVMASALAEQQNTLDDLLIERDRLRDRKKIPTTITSAAPPPIPGVLNEVRSRLMISSNCTFGSSF